MNHKNYLTRLGPKVVHILGLQLSEKPPKCQADLLLVTG